MKPKRGRPKLPKQEAKDETLRIRMTREERAAVEKAAKKADMVLSEWARKRLLEGVD